MKTFDNWRRKRIDVGDPTRYQRTNGESRTGTVVEKYRDTLEVWPFSAYFYVIQDDNPEFPLYTTRHASALRAPVHRPRRKTQPRAVTLDREREALKVALGHGGTVSVNEDETARMIAAETMVAEGTAVAVSDAMVATGRATRLRRVLTITRPAR